MQWSSEATADYWPVFFFFTSTHEASTKTPAITAAGLSACQCALHVHFVTFYNTVFDTMVCLIVGMLIAILLQNCVDDNESCR